VFVVATTIDAAIGEEIDVGVLGAAKLIEDALNTLTLQGFVLGGGHGAVAANKARIWIISA